MELTWADLHHRELTPQRLHDILALRNAVFVVEQDCAYQDIDGRDLLGDNRHLFGAAHSTDGPLVAYARLLAPDAAHEAARIGRVIVTNEARGLRLGQQLMERAVASCAQHWPDAPVSLSAQAHLRPFYGGLGFTPVSDVYDEDGIPHVDMRKPPA